MLPYNPKSRDSIIRYAKKLKNKSLKEVCDEGVIFNNNDGKGNYGV